MSTELITLPGPRPMGYAEARIGRGRALHVAGQVGWKAGVFEAKDLVGQFAQALENILAILAESQARPEHIVRLTWYITSRDEYHAERKHIGAAYRAVMGRHFPAMSVVQVVALMEAQAKVEIEATAVIPHAR